MVTRKQIWEELDKLEGKKIGVSYKKLQKELIYQGYKKKSKKKSKKK